MRSFEPADFDSKLDGDRGLRPVHAAPDGPHTALADWFHDVEWAKRVHAVHLARQTSVVKCAGARQEGAKDREFFGDETVCLGVGDDGGVFTVW